MKFDFSKYDKKWRWFAVDEDGSAYLYTAKPSLYRFAWASSDDLVIELEGQFDNHCWYYSLQEREDEEMEKLVNFLDMEEGKRYERTDSQNARIDYKKEGNVLFKIENDHDGWVPSTLSVNTAMKLIFREIKKPVRIPDETTPIDTRVRIRSDDKHEWEKRYFAFYNPKGEKKFYTFALNHKSDKGETAIAWKYCEIIEEDN